MSGPAHLDALLWLLLAPGIVLGMIASIRMRNMHRRFLKVPLESGVSGLEAARAILDANGLTEIPIIEVPGHLTDHYDLLKRRLCLSSENHRGRSVAAVCIAAHEAGHALQQHEDYRPLRIRLRLTPVALFATPLSVVLVLAGLFFMNTFAGRAILLMGTGLFALATIFQLITLPIEFDASKRAMKNLHNLGLVSGSESGNMSDVLRAAAMTYVAGLIDVGGMFWFKR